MKDAYLATFLQLLVALGVLVVASLATEDLGLLGEATALSLFYFSLAGIIHFSLGWDAPEHEPDADRRSAHEPRLLATTAVFGAAIAVVILQEVPGWPVWLGVLIVTAGAFCVSLEPVSEEGWGVSGRTRSPGLPRRLPGRRARS